MDLGTGRGEDGVLALPVPASSGQKAQQEALGIGLVDDVVHMIPIAVVPDRWPGWVAIHQRQVPIGIGGVEPILFGQRHRLDHTVNPFAARLLR